MAQYTSSGTMLNKAHGNLYSKFHAGLFVRRKVRRRWRAVLNGIADCANILQKHKHEAQVPGAGFGTGPIKLRDEAGETSTTPQRRAAVRTDGGNDLASPHVELEGVGSNREQATPHAQSSERTSTMSTYCEGRKEGSKEGGLEGRGGKGSEGKGTEVKGREGRKEG